MAIKPKFGREPCLRTGCINTTGNPKAKYCSDACRKAHKRELQSIADGVQLKKYNKAVRPPNRYGTIYE